MEGYTKLFRGITKSTVWSLDNDHKAVWVFLMAEADQHGNVICTVPGLAKANDVSVEKAAEIVRCFMSPDPYSGSKEFEGRRIVEIDRGWHVLNHAKYRALRSKEEKAEYNRVYMENKRLEGKVAKLEDKKANKTGAVVNSSKQSPKVAEVAQADAHASASASGSNWVAGTTTKTPAAESATEPPTFDLEPSWRLTKEIWENAGTWPGGENLAAAKKKFTKKITASNWSEFVLGLDWAVANSKQRRDRNWLGVLCTFLDDEKWKDQSNPYKQAPVAAEAPHETPKPDVIADLGEAW